MQAIRHAVIVAAGLGSRLGMQIPKCLLDIGDEKLIYYQIKLLRHAGISEIRIVVGYKEQRVIDYVRQFDKNIVFVRNNHYDTTTMADSLSLASRDLNEDYIFIGGDLVIDPRSFKLFYEQCLSNAATTIGYTNTKTENAIFVNIDTFNNLITHFPKDTATEFEWSSIAYIKSQPIQGNKTFLFNELEPHLPLKSCYINCYEIDTPNDLSLLAELDIGKLYEEIIKQTDKELN